MKVVVHVGNSFSKYKDKRLPHFYVYGYCKIIINVSKKLNTLKFCSHTMDLFYTLRIFSINSCCACLNIAKVGMVISKYVDKRSLCCQVYGYYKVIINVSKNTNKIFTLCEQILSMYYQFSTHDKYDYISKIDT